MDSLPSASLRASCGASRRFKCAVLGANGSSYAGGTLVQISCGGIAVRGLADAMTFMNGLAASVVLDLLEVCLRERERKPARASRTGSVCGLLCCGQIASATLRRALN
jgi:hypothetical protein